MTNEFEPKTMASNEALMHRVNDLEKQNAKLSILPSRVRSVIKLVPSNEVSTVKATNETSVVET
jgi:hypothetical protein